MQSRGLMTMVVACQEDVDILTVRQTNLKDITSLKVTNLRADRNQIIWRENRELKSREKIREN